MGYKEAVEDNIKIKRNETLMVKCGSWIPEIEGSTPST